MIGEDFDNALGMSRSFPVDTRIIPEEMAGMSCTFPMDSRKNDRSRIRPLDAGVIQDNVPTLVIPSLFIGSIHCALNIEALSEFGITHILNASEWPCTFPNAFTYFNIHVRDKEQANILCCIPASNIFIESGITKGRVLVHCHGGRSRSAAFVVAYLMYSRTIGYDDALKILRQARPVVSLNRGFEEQLRAYSILNYDIYKAQQYFIRSRIREIWLIRESYKSGVASGTTSPQDFSQLSKFCEKIILPPKSKTGTSLTPRPDARSFLIGPFPNTKLRLSKPKSSAAQVIPPCRGLERAFTCLDCGSYLFTISNVLRTDVPVSDEVDRTIRFSMSPPPTSARSPRPLEPIGESRASSSPKLRPIFAEPPQTTRHSKKGFSFNSPEFEMSPRVLSKPPSKPKKKTIALGGRFNIFGRNNMQ